MTAPLRSSRARGAIRPTNQPTHIRSASLSSSSSIDLPPLFPNFSLQGAQFWVGQPPDAPLPSPVPQSLMQPTASPQSSVGWSGGSREIRFSRIIDFSSSPIHLSIDGRSIPRSPPRSLSSFVLQLRLRPSLVSLFFRSIHSNGSAPENGDSGGASERARRIAETEKGRMEGGRDGSKEVELARSLSLSLPFCKA